MWWNCNLFSSITELLLIFLWWYWSNLIFPNIWICRKYLKHNSRTVPLADVSEFSRLIARLYAIWIYQNNSWKFHPFYKAHCFESHCIHVFLTHHIPPKRLILDLNCHLHCGTYICIACRVLDTFIKEFEDSEESSYLATEWKIPSIKLLIVLNFLHSDTQTILYNLVNIRRRKL